MGVQPPHTYTVEEANAALEQVRPLVERLVIGFGTLPDLQEAARGAEYRAARPGATGADQAQRDAARRAVEDAELGLAEAMLRLERLGIAVKDPRTGLIDFYSYREGELVELCWKLGEPSVGHWHRIGDGYPGRRRL